MTCKSMFYLIQNLHFLESGRFLLRKKDLKAAVAEPFDVQMEYRL